VAPPLGAVLRCAIVRRVSVVGTSGAGKSTLARELAVILGVPYLELDGLNHQPGWEPLPKEEFRRIVAAKAAEDGWVIDGNYSAVQPLVWARADTVAWLDLPKSIVMRQVVWRTLRRVAGRQELWNGNRERWRNFFTWDPEQSVISWAWHKHDEYHTRYAAATDHPANAHLRFVRLTSRHDVSRFLDEARDQARDEARDEARGAGRDAGPGSGRAGARDGTAR
jgi:adenylate kinase family enzyme